ncbi:uncharacterized protein LOC107616080 [Arachis ipaensis]|uniref:uncharacterized protein LOC107616080 n=1 Tax=Arachis ipaensis TaxID=130454 RepID=UPI0007AF7C45|nr:uncharacterized protein LOC107616080 [Arachis ipaensis]
MNETRAKFKNQDASIRNLEVQVGQIAKQLAKPTNTFPSDIEFNPREECKIISLRSGRVIVMKNKEQAEAPLEVEEEKEKEKDHAQPNAPKEKEIVKQYEPRVPFTQRVKEENKENQYSKILEVFRKLQINISFIEALKQMHLYTKFMKELLSKKKTLREDETMVMTKECSSIIQKGFPRKMKDSGRFQIPCTIGSTTFE